MPRAVISPYFTQVRGIIDIGIFLYVCLWPLLVSIWATGIGFIFYTCKLINIRRGNLKTTFLMLFTFLLLPMTSSIVSWLVFGNSMSKDVLVINFILMDCIILGVLPVILGYGTFRLRTLGLKEMI